MAKGKLLDLEQQVNECVDSELKLISTTPKSRTVFSVHWRNSMRPFVGHTLIFF